MTHYLVLILGLAGVVAYFLTPDERARLFRTVLPALDTTRRGVTLEDLQADPFFDALRARTPRLVATPALVVLSTLVFVRSPVLELLVSAVGLWQIGLILERLLGRLAFATVYVASAVAAAIVTLSASTNTSIGASGPVLGMYGLLLVTWMWATFGRSSLAIPPHVIKKLAPVAAVFVLYKLVTTGFANVTDVATLVCGLVGGIVVARDVDERTPQFRRLATAMATVVMAVTTYALVVAMMQRPLDTVTDVRPEIDRVMAVENRTAGLYEKEVERFRKGRTTAAALGDVIDKVIVPELRAMSGRLGALKDVPPEQQALIASAETFLKLRHESWQLRATALHKSDMRGLRRADNKEQMSREAFQRLSDMAREQNHAEYLNGTVPSTL